MAQSILSTDALRVLEDYEKAKEDCKPWHNNINRWRAWYDGDHYQVASKRGKAKPGEERYQDPTPTNVVDLAIGIILSTPLEFRASGWSPTFGEEEDSSHIEKYLLGTISINNEREERLNEYMALFYFVRDGASVLFSAWDDSLAEEHRAVVNMPDKQMGIIPTMAFKETPIRLQVIDPKKTFWKVGGPRRWEAVFRVETDMSLFEVEANYNNGQRISGYDTLSKDSMRKEHLGELMDVWRWKYKSVELPPEVPGGEVRTMKKWIVQHGLFYDKKPVWEMEDTNYDELPYTVQFYKPVDVDDPKGWGHSIIRPLEESLIFMENSINRRQRQINVFSALPLMGKVMSGRQMHIDRALFNFIQLQPDEDIAFPQWRGNAPDVDAQIDHFSGRLQQAGFTEAAFGRGSEETGYALSQMTDQNRIRLEQPVRHLQLLWSTWARKVLRLTETFAPEAVVRVYGQMRGKDFKEQVKTVGLADYLISAKLKPQFPGEQTRKHAMAVQVAGIVDQRTLLEEYLDKPQPDEIIERRMHDMAKQHPMMIQYGVMVALQEMADEGDEVAEMVIQMMQQQAQGGQQGGAPGGGDMGAGTGLASQDGNTTPQEQGREASGQGIMSKLSNLINKGTGGAG
jgi:hypothetical protein